MLSSFFFNPWSFIRLLSLTSLLPEHYRVCICSLFISCESVKLKLVSGWGRRHETPPFSSFKFNGSSQRMGSRVTASFLMITGCHFPLSPQSPIPLTLIFRPIPNALIIPQLINHLHFSCLSSPFLSWHLLPPHIIPTCPHPFSYLSLFMLSLALQSNHYYVVTFSHTRALFQALLSLHTFLVPAPFMHTLHISPSSATQGNSARPYSATDTPERPRMNLMTRMVVLGRHWPDSTVSKHSPG